MKAHRNCNRIREKEVAAVNRWKPCLGEFLVVLVALTALVTLPGNALSKDLVVYSSVDEENAKKILNEFTKATGIKAQMVFLSTGPALSRIEAEKANPQADIWFGAPNENHIIAKNKGLTQPYVSRNAAGVDANFRDPQGYWHAFYMNPLGMGVLADELGKRGIKVPAAWTDLLNPVYKGLIQMPSPQASGTALALIMTLVEIYGENKAYEVMKSMNPNVQTYTQSGTGPAKSLAIGEAKIAVQFTPAFLQLIDEGYPVKVIFPTEGVGYESPALSILKGAKNQEAGKNLVDWIISKQGQETLGANKTFFFPVRRDVSAGKGLPKLSDIKLVEYDRVALAKDRNRLVDRWVKDVLGK
jgi:iron(III) transport system substrate-binding protein